MPFVLSPRAQADIEDIWMFTAGRWGEPQSERYVTLLRDIIVAEAHGPRLGRSCDDVRGGYFRLAAGSHVIFYKLDGDQLDVVRVLHGRMDIARHL